MVLVMNSSYIHIQVRLICLIIPVVISSHLFAEQINEDLIVKGSVAVGQDAVGFSFGFDTLRIEENNLRLFFNDTSESGSFPGNDWRILINDTDNGGDSYFGIEDSTHGRVLFRADAGAPANSLRIDSNGRLGILESSPDQHLHITSSASPAIRLQQSGAEAQIWDIYGSHDGLFITDVTSDSAAFVIESGAPTDSIRVNSGGRLGIRETSPARDIHINSGFTPGIRLEQSSKTGNLPQTWDLYGSHTAFFLRDESAGHNVFSVESGAPSDSIVVNSVGAVGFRSAAPARDLHIASSDTPAIRLEQTTDEGNLAQSWDVAGSDELWFLSNVNAGEFPVKVYADANSDGLVLRGGNLGSHLTTPLHKVHFNVNQESGESVLIGRASADTALATFHVDGTAYISGNLEIGSSRTLKKDVRALQIEEAVAALAELEPVQFSYKNQTDPQLGFIAEDVPDVVATSSGKSLSPMDFVALLTRVVQEQEQRLANQESKIEELSAVLQELRNSTE